MGPSIQVNCEEIFVSPLPMRTLEAERGKQEWSKEKRSAGDTRGEITFPPAWGFAANPASPKLFHFVCISKRFILCRITAPTFSNTHWSLKMKENEFLRMCNFDGSHCASTYCKEASYFSIVVFSLGRELNTTQPLTPSPPPLSDGGERKGKKPKSVPWEKGNLRGQKQMKWIIIK